MSFKGREKHFFLGGNTPEGFYSYYEHLLPQENARRIYCIKGGPGTGKSTLMKKIAAEAAAKGADTELAHCSSDPDSLDGVIIKSVGIAFVDGTSPHIVDPKTPGAVDTIIHLGDCWDFSAIARHKEAIMRTNRKISEQFSRAYAYLGAAKCIQNDLNSIYEMSIKGNVYAELEEDIIFREFAEIPVSPVRGAVRRLFASAITPKGIVNYAQSVLNGYKMYVIKGYSASFLQEICRNAVNRGFDAEMYMCPFSPSDKCDHLLIPKLNLAFTASNEYHSCDNGETVDFNEYASKYILETHRKEREFAKMQINLLIDSAVGAISEAKEYHDELEKYYIPAMDFDKIDKITEKTIKEVLEFI